MTKQNTKSKKGFTIIEVVLVLAIAGLIFLMVFIAYPALRRSQSDTQRREDMSKALSQLTSYIANNRKPPMGDSGSTKYTNFFNNYLLNQSEGFADPDGNNYAAQYCGECKGADETDGCFGGKDDNGNTEGCTKPSALDHNVYYFYHAKCATDADFPKKATGDKEVALVYYLEGGGMYCGSNSN